jgi:hypothetical protein
MTGFVDTLKLYTEDFQVKPGAELTIQPSVIDYATGEIDDKKLFGNVRGAKAYNNNDRFNLTIKPGKAGNGVYLWVQSSVPKFLNGENFHASDHEREFVPALEKELRSRGIGADVSQMRISRLDAFRNIYAEETFEDYTSIFKMLKAKRQNRRDYGSTYLWSNNERETCIYDKLAEVKSRGGSVAGLPANTLRFEYRLLKSRSVKAGLGSNRASTVLADTACVAEAYKKSMTENLFRLDVSGFEKLLGSQFYVAINHFASTGSRYWMRELRTAFGDYGIAKSIGAERFRLLVEEATGDRNLSWRAGQAVDQGFQTVALLTESVGQKTLIQLYEELRGKVLA